MTSGPKTPDSGDPDRCSAKGCQTTATWQLLWNNPKLHTPERRKVWLACDEHKSSLSDFLGARQFLKDVQPHEQAG
ncbi:MAG: acetone carboxylase [Nocardioides sp.]|nr:acetone carboxylase [Nocardioides sp.]